MAEDTPAPIATPEEVALRIVEANSDGDSFTDNKAWLNKDGMVLAIAAALASSNAEIERLTRERDDAKAALTRWGDVGVFNALQAANARFLLAEAEARTLRNTGVDLLDRSRAAEARIATLTAEVGRLREALTMADQTITSVSDNAYRTGLEGTSEWDAITGGKLFVTQDAIRAALSPAEPDAMEL